MTKNQSTTSKVRAINKQKRRPGCQKGPATKGAASRWRPAKKLTLLSLLQPWRPPRAPLPLPRTLLTARLNPAAALRWPRAIWARSFLTAIPSGVLLAANGLKDTMLGKMLSSNGLTLVATPRQIRPGFFSPSTLPNVQLPVIDSRASVHLTCLFHFAATVPHR